MYLAVDGQWQPSWKPLDRATVEALVGSPVP